jgi:hypothetical protein
MIGRRVPRVPVLHLGLFTLPHTSTAVANQLLPAQLSDSLRLAPTPFEYAPPFE